MAGLVEDTIGGFNGMIEKQRALEGEALVTTVLFNQDSVTLHDRVPLNEVQPLTSREYSAGGMTALLDAVGETMEHIRILHDYAGEAGRPEHTIFIITTDGLENSSHRYSVKQIKDMVSAARQERKWEFLFLGRDGAPSEEEQYEAYRKVAEAMGGKETVIRTIDGAEANGGN